MGWVGVVNDHMFRLTVFRKIKNFLMSCVGGKGELLDF